MRLFVFIVMTTLVTSLYAKDYRVMLGESPIVVRYLQGKGKTYVHLHSNEGTALKAAQMVIAKKGGSLITLVHSGERNVRFSLHKQEYMFDPNRIFTPQGIKNTLAQLSHYTPEARKEVDKLASQIKRLLPKGKVIAVHNNVDYSLNYYLPGQLLAGDAKRVYKNSQLNYRNFYFVTKFNDYLRLKAKGFNGVLQANAAKDDGSLSIWLAKSRFLNVEAGFDQLQEQIKMLEYA